MEIIYKQTLSDEVLKSLGIQNCYLKHLCAKTDSKTTFCKTHHHTGFEIHFVNKGHQTYIINEKEYTLSDGHILLIPPLVKHYVADTQFYDSKFSITFNLSAISPFETVDDIIFLKENERIFNNLHQALKESKISSDFSKHIIPHCIYESLVILLRISGFKEKQDFVTKICDDDRLTFAKQYIKDNIEFNITVSDVSVHCFLSTKQLTRLFKTHEGITPLCYIQRQRIRHIESLLLSGMRLKEVSERMNFSSEYHFNSFYKKYAGLSPGVYQKMHIQ